MIRHGKSEDNLRKVYSRKSTSLTDDGIAEVLKTKVLGRLALQQPYEEEDIFAPSVYQEDHPNGQEYRRIAAKIVAQLEEGQ